MKKTFGIIFMTFVLFILVSAFKRGDAPKPWPVPAASSAKKNPIASNATSIADGKELYGTHCASCHGKKGKGDGSKAAQLETDCGDLSSALSQKQTDGDLFYKIQVGRDDMPSFKKKIPEADDIWSIVNYVRTLKQ
ncbi:MAG: c-type cytochrome [Chitinophagales bacterium]